MTGFSLLHPAVRVQYSSDRIVLIRSSVGLRLQLDSALKVLIHRGEENPILGWYSPGYDRKDPTWTVRGSSRAKGRLRHSVERF